MSITALADMTWEEVDALDAGRTVVILPVAAVEAHGPHLPLGTDGIIADAMASSGAERLAARGWNVLLLPRLDYTPAGFAAAFPGTVPVKPEVFSALVVDIVVGLAQHGLETVVLANSHFDPDNLRALEEAVRRVGEETTARLIFPNVTRKPWALRLTDEFKSGACHAGRYEGSIVLAAQPGAVRKEIQAALPENPSSLSVATRKGLTTFEAAGGRRAYFGAPAESTAEEGRETIATLGRILEEATLAALDPSDPGEGADS